MKKKISTFSKFKKKLFNEDIYFLRVLFWKALWVEDARHPCTVLSSLRAGRRILEDSSGSPPVTQMDGSALSREKEALRGCDRSGCRSFPRALSRTTSFDDVWASGSWSHETLTPFAPKSAHFFPVPHNRFASHPGSWPAWR